MSGDERPTDPRDALILSLCEKLYICSRLLTRAAERLSWDEPKVQELVEELKSAVVRESCQYLEITRPR